MVHRSVAGAAMMVLVAALALGAGRGEARADEPAVWVWIDPRPLGASKDAAAEAAVFEATLSATMERFVGVSAADREVIRGAAGAFARREPVVIFARCADRKAGLEMQTGNGAPEAGGEVGTGGAVAAHRAWATAQAGKAAPVLEVFVDMNALRREFAATFDDGGRGLRTAGALGVANARSLMLHGRWVEAATVPSADPALPLPPSAQRIGEYRGAPLVRLDLSWNSRADDLSTVRGVNIAAGHWPASQLRTSPPAGAFACMVRMTWCVRLEQALLVNAAWQPGSSAADMMEISKRWHASARPQLDRVCSSLQSWMVTSFDGKSPGLVRLEARSRADGAAAGALMQDVLKLAAPLDGAVTQSRGLATYRWAAGLPVVALSWGASETEGTRGLIGAASLAGSKADAEGDVRGRMGK